MNIISVSTLQTWHPTVYLDVSIFVLSCEDKEVHPSNHPFIHLPSLYSNSFRGFAGVFPNIHKVKAGNIYTHTQQHSFTHLGISSGPRFQCFWTVGGTKAPGKKSCALHPEIPSTWPRKSTFLGWPKFVLFPSFCWGKSANHILLYIVLSLSMSGTAHLIPLKDLLCTSQPLGRYAKPRTAPLLTLPNCLGLVSLGLVFLEFSDC